MAVDVKTNNTCCLVCILAVSGRIDDGIYYDKTWLRNLYFELKRFKGV